MVKKALNIEFSEDFKGFTNFPTIPYQDLSIEIISPSKICNCNFCDLNFRSQRKLEKHRKKCVIQRNLSFGTKKEILD